MKVQNLRLSFIDKIESRLQYYLHIKNNVIIQALCNLQYLLGENLLARIFTKIKGANPVYKVWMYNMQGKLWCFFAPNQRKLWSQTFRLEVLTYTHKD